MYLNQSRQSRANDWLCCSLSEGNTHLKKKICLSLFLSFVCCRTAASFTSFPFPFFFILVSKMTQKKSNEQAQGFILYLDFNFRFVRRTLHTRRRLLTSLNLKLSSGKDMGLTDHRWATLAVEHCRSFTQAINKCTQLVLCFLTALSFVTLRSLYGPAVRRRQLDVKFFLFFCGNWSNVINGKSWRGSQQRRREKRGAAVVFVTA